MAQWVRITRHGRVLPRPQLRSQVVHRGSLLAACSHWPPWSPSRCIHHPHRSRPVHRSPKQRQPERRCPPRHRPNTQAGLRRHRQPRRARSRTPRSRCRPCRWCPIWWPARRRSSVTRTCSPRTIRTSSSSCRASAAAKLPVTRRTPTASWSPGTRMAACALGTRMAWRARFASTWRVTRCGCAHQALRSETFARPSRRNTRSTPDARRLPLRHIRVPSPQVKCRQVVLL